MQVMRGACNDPAEVGLWRLALKTVGRTLLVFTVPYLAAYYAVIGAWQGIHMLMLWMAGVR